VKVIAYPDPQSRLGKHFGLRDAGELLPLAIRPRFASDDHAAVFLSGAVAQEAKPCGSVYRVRADELLAVECRGFNVQPVHEMKEKSPPARAVEIGDETRLAQTDGLKLIGFISRLSTACVRSTFRPALVKSNLDATPYPPP
jgi:hypothetical protein